MLKVSKLTVGVVLLCATSAHAVELPPWNVARICSTENAVGQCRIFEAEAKRTIAGGWAALPDAYRSACLEEIKEPYASYRSLSQCLEQQVLHGRELREIHTATTPTLGASVSSTPSDDGKIETLEDYFKLRDSWGRGQEGSLQTKPIRFAALPSPIMDVPQPFFQVTERIQDEDDWAERLAGNQDPNGFLPVMIATAESLADFLAERDSWGKGPAQAQAGTDTLAQDSQATQGTEVSRDQIDKALADLLAERESWGTEPGTTATAAPEEPRSPSAESEPAVTDLAGYLSRRDSWGTGSPPKPVNAPLAAGAVSPLPSTTTPAATADETPAIVHPVELSPVPQLTEVPRADIDKALADLLAERESWSASTTAASSQPGPQPGAQAAEAAACEADLREAIRTGTVLFGSNSATLDATSFTTLDQVFERAQACQNAFISVEGHTDDLGSDAMNNRLSEQRAKAVMNYLVKKGVDSSRIEAVGFGKSHPLVPNTSAENRAKNRRIELRVR